MLFRSMPKWKALPIFSSDALSSVGYGPEQIAIVLASVPTLATYRYFGPIVLAIIALLFIVALSYTQVVRVNPGGGGSYGIAMKYLGVYPALTAGAALLADFFRRHRGRGAEAALPGLTGGAARLAASHYSVMTKSSA